MFWIALLALSVGALAIAELCGRVVDQLKSAMKSVASSIGSVRIPKGAGEPVMLNKRHKILVVDDEHAIASALASILERQGYETATAYSGEEAIQAACSFQPDFILCDVMMGMMNGVDAALEILRAQPKCKVLFISGNAGYRDLLGKAMAKGFKFEVLEKPISPLELLGRISQILSCRPSQTEQLAV